MKEGNRVPTRIPFPNKRWVTLRGGRRVPVEDKADISGKERFVREGVLAHAKVIPLRKPYVDDPSQSVLGWQVSCIEGKTFDSEQEAISALSWVKSNLNSERIERLYLRGSVTLGDGDVGR